jgi:glucose-1-phosphate adenylyltransferase
MDQILAVLLAGGAGERLSPLTRHTAKPAVSFGGMYRLIDFILTQYKALELIRHLRGGWYFLPSEVGEFVEVIPPMKRVHEDWYLGTADAVYQNYESVAVEAPSEVLILGADHIYKMNYREMIDWHRKQNADVTIATIQMEPEEAPRFGIAEIASDYHVFGFEEKPQHGNPTRSVFNPDKVSGSMGIYVFRPEVLRQLLFEDADIPDSNHDFGKDVLPRAIDRFRVVAYDFHDLNDKSACYWRDVGTLDAYYDANMDLVAVTPIFNLYDERWPIRTRLTQAPPAKFVFAQEGRRMGVAIDSIVSPGCIISGGRVIHSVLSPGVRVNSYCEIEGAIILSNTHVGRNSRISRAIIDENVRIPESSVIGLDPEQDRANGHFVTESGIVVVTQ